MRSRGSQPAVDFRRGWLSRGGDAGERIGLGSVLGMRNTAPSGRVSGLPAMPAGGRRSEAGGPSPLVGSAPRLEPPVSGRGYDVRGAGRRACRSEDRRSQPGVRSSLVGFAPRLEPPVSGRGYDVRGAGRRVCRSEDRRSQAGVLRRQSGGWWFLGSRDGGEEAEVVSPAARAMPAGGRRSEGVAFRRSGGWIFLRSGDRGEQTYATSPAGGGLCRLKPAFQAGGAVPAWRASGRWAA